jgi:hypothetical protein
MCDPQSTDWDAPLALTVTGTLAEGTQLLRDPVGAGEECLYLSFEEDRGAALPFLHSSGFRGAAGKARPCGSTSPPWRCGWNWSAIDAASPSLVVGAELSSASALGRSSEAPAAKPSL